MSFNVTIENYDEKREELVALNSNMLGVVMREKEIEADKYLSSIKAEYRESVNAENAYQIPVLTDKDLIKSKLYEFCKALPKGADLHVHDMALLPFCELVPLLESCKEFCINTDKKNYNLITVGENDAVPDGYMRFFKAMESGYYSLDELCRNWTVAGAEKSGLNIWEYFENLFERQAALSCNNGFAEKYYKRAFRYYAENNIMHVEIHIMLTEDVDETAEYVKAMRSAYYCVKKDYPYFTVRIIGAGVKADNDNIELSKKCFFNTSYVQEIIKDESSGEKRQFIIGFDLVNEEDTSLPLKKFAPMLIKARKQFPEMKLYVHGGESLDAGNDNLIDAYLLGASRVGHGLNLYRFPDLHSRFVKAEICLEVCPISNQRLGYTKDIRNHPATEYLRSGMAISLCSDDPAYMENSTLTDDFFAAVYGWDLNIADIKQLCINSIMYSGLDEKTKYESLKAYNTLWNDFIEKINTQNT